MKILVTAQTLRTFHVHLLEELLIVSLLCFLLSQLIMKLLFIPGQLKYFFKALTDLPLSKNPLILEKLIRLTSAEAMLILQYV